MTDELRPAKLWRSLPVDVRVAAASAFWNDEQAALEQAESVALIAKQIKFRPKSVVSLPVERKARHLASLGHVSDLVAARLLVAYHLAEQRPMMGRFLDLLGITHDNGLISEESPTKPADDKLTEAVTSLNAEFPKADVTRYFWTLLWQDPDTWGGLSAHVAAGQS